MPEYNLPANFGTFVLVFDIYATSSSASTNTSTVYYNAYLKKTGGSTAVQPFNGNPSTIKVWLDSAAADPNRHNHTVTYDFRSPNNAIGATVGLGASGTVNFTHNTNGTRSVTWRARFEGNGGSPLGTADSGYQTLTLSDFDRSANTPYYNNITRTSATNIDVEYARTGSVNGPTTYVLERATNAAMSANYTTVSEGSQTVDANTTYYYRMYAYGDEGGNKYSGVYGPYHGQPTQPASITPTNPTNSEDRIVVPFSGPSYVGSGISSYTITRSGTNSDGSTSKVFTGITTTPFIDTDSIKVPGNPYNYTIQALTSAGTGYPAYTSNGTTSSNVTSAGPPYSPPSVPTVSSLGLSITVTSSAVTANGGIAINTANTNEGYFVQYQLADTLNGTYGYNGTAGAWSPAVKMSDQTNRQHTYSSMTPAKYYKFRTYAANPVIYGSNGSTQLYYPHNNLTYTANFATTSTGYFLAAGGKRFDGTNWIPTQTAKRFDGTNWVPLTIAKRFDGTNWVPLS